METSDEDGSGESGNTATRQTIPSLLYQVRKSALFAWESPLANPRYPPISVLLVLPPPRRLGVALLIPHPPEQENLFTRGCPVFDGTPSHPYALQPKSISADKKHICCKSLSLSG
jgi:hypothetical protein